MASQFLNKFAANPFKTYFKIGSGAFGFTFIGNLLWTSLDKDAPLSIRENPEMYASCLLAKSAYAGLLWPAIPFRIVSNPRKFFCLGGGVQSMYGWELNTVKKHIKKFDDDD